MILINSFMYHHEAISSAYEGAGWAFPTKTYWHTLPTRIHFQGYEIICCSHLPSPSNPYASDILEESLNPNWQVPEEYQEAHYDRKHEAPLQRDWNTAFDACYRPAFYSNPAYKTQCQLQKIIKSTKSSDELDAIYQLHRKETDVVGFSNIVDLLANTSLPRIWPLSGLDPELPYSFSDKHPYPNFLQINSNPPTLYLPYFNHNNDQICVKEGFFTNSYIGNLHYFVGACFTIFESHAFFPMPNIY